MKRLAIIMGLATSTAFCQTPSPSAQTPSLNSSYFSHIEGINGSGTGTFALGSGMRVCLTSAVVPILSGCSVGLSLAAAGIASLDTATAGNGAGTLNLATLVATADIVAQVGTNPAPYTVMTPTVVVGGTATQNFAFYATTGNVELSGIIGFPGTGTPDTGLSRTAAGVVAIGNGTAGDASGNLLLAKVNYLPLSYDSTHQNTAVGVSTGTSSGTANTAIGSNVLQAMTNGASNTAIGAGALANLTTGSTNVAVGVNAGQGSGLTNLINDVFLGSGASATSGSLTNMIVIGAGAIGSASNAVYLGNNSVTAGYLGGQQICTIATGCGSHSDYGSIQGALFATNTMLGPVFHEATQVKLATLTARLSGTISCTVAPTVAFMDLGTSASTSFGSAVGTVASISTGTSDGVYSGTFSVNMTPGDYYGFAFTGGTCVTAPTFDLTAQMQ